MGGPHRGGTQRHRCLGEPGRWPPRHEIHVHHLVQQRQLRHDLRCMLYAQRAERAERADAAREGSGLQLGSTQHHRSMRIPGEGGGGCWL